MHLVQAVCSALYEGTWSIDQCDTLEDGTRQNRRFEFGQESGAVSLQRPEWQMRLQCQCIAGYALLVFAVQQCHEPICCWLWANVTAREIAAEQVCNESGFAD